MSHGLGSNPPRLPSCAVGETQPTNPPEPLSDVRCADARSAKICLPAGVALHFQVILYKVPPSEAIRGRNLLSKDNWRAADLDQVVEGWPQVPLVSKPSSFARRGERLARAGSGPQGHCGGDAGKLEGSAPPSDTGEEVALCESKEFIGTDIFNRPLIHHPSRNQSSLHQLSEPGGSKRIMLVVVVAH